MGEVKESPMKHGWIRKTDDEPVIITPRKYEMVAGELKLPENYFVGVRRVLSVGEGLSDFASHLHRENGVNIVSIDPIYEHGDKILQTDPRLVKEAFQEIYGKTVRFENMQGMEQLADENILISLPEKDRIVAASIYNLPFLSESFDRIMSNRVFEHIDFSVALPELLRVLSKEGEIRMAGLGLNLFPTSGKILSEMLVMFNAIEGTWNPHPGLGDSLKLLAGNKQIETYIVTGKLPLAKVGRQYPEMRIGTMIIIRKDKNAPKIKKDDEHQTSSINRIFKLLHEKSKTDSVTGRSCYRIVEVFD